MKNPPPPSLDVPAKRARIVSLTGSELLPCEVWGAVCEFVNYSDLLSLSLVSRFFLHHVMCKLRFMEVRTINELHVAPAHRFRNVTELNIMCFVQGCDDNYLKIDTEVPGRILPFISRLPKLQSLYIGGYYDNSNDRIWYIPDACRTDRHAEVMRGLFRTFSGAFASGLLSKNLLTSIRGLQCPNVTIVNDGMPETCTECEKALAHLPMNIFFKSFETALRRFGCGVVTCRTDLEIFKTTMARAADSNAVLDLRNYIESLLAQGHFVEGPRNKLVVDYNDDLLDTIEHICSTFEFAPLPAANAIAAMSCCYMHFSPGPIPPPKKRFLVKETFERLIALGIPLNEKDFRLISRNKVEEV